MADIRFTDKTLDATPAAADIVPGTQVSTGNDKKYTFSAIANTVATLIGVATTIANGLMSSTDKVKLDAYATHAPGNDKILTTNGSGVQVWENQSSLLGDMTQAVYDTGSLGRVDDASVARAMYGTPGNDKFWGSNGSGVQMWLAQSTVGDMKKTSYDTGATGNSVDLAISATNAVDSAAVNTHVSRKWSGQTTNATPTELFLDGGSSQLTVGTDEMIGAMIHVVGFQDDETNGCCFFRQVAIKNAAGTTALVGAVQTVGVDIDDSAGVSVALTADDPNDALVVTVTGRAAETWNWKVFTIENRI